MQDKTTKFQKAKKFLTYVLLSSIFAILVTLGFWQIHRLEQKKYLVTSIIHNLQADPIDLSDYKGNDLYAKVKLSGHFLEDQDIYLYGRKSGTSKPDGYYLLTPFQTKDDQIIIVARGWFSREDLPSLKNTSKNTLSNFPEEICGIIMPSEKKLLFVPENDFRNRVWFTLDLNNPNIDEIFNFKAAKFYLLQLKPQNLPAGVTFLSTDRLVMIRNDHLEYAITWFSLAVALLVIIIVYYLKNIKVRD